MRMLFWRIKPNNRCLTNHVRYFANTSQAHTETTSPTECFDLVINGGGIVGLSLLASLSRNPWFQDKRILLLEQQSRPQPPEKERPEKETQPPSRILSNRVSSLTTCSKDFLDSLGIWHLLNPFSKTASSMYVWASSFEKGITFSPKFPGISDFLCNRGSRGIENDDAVCYFLENHRILEALEGVIPAEKIRFGVTVKDIKGVKGAGDQVDLVVNEGSSQGSQLNEGTTHTIRTKLLVGCDGFNSLTRRLSTLKYFEKPLEESAIIGTVELDAMDTQNSVCLQRFLPSDKTVIGLLPLTSSHSSFVVSTSKVKAKMMMDLDEEGFVEAMNALLTCEDSVSNAWPRSLKPVVEGVDKVLKRVVSAAYPSESELPLPCPPEIKRLVPKSRASFPLSFGTTCPNMIGSPQGSNTSDNKRIVIIGDSCHRIPPLAGQGLNLGIGDAIQLAECLSEGLEKGEDLFNDHEALGTALNSFERSRQLKLLPMLAAVASMQKLFTMTPDPLLHTFNRFNLLKNEVVKFANSR